MQVISAYLAHTNQELLLSVIYSRPLLGSSFPIHACLSQMHGQECLQRGVYTQLLCRSTGVGQDTVTRLSDNPREKIKFIKHLTIFYIYCNSLLYKCPEPQLVFPFPPAVF